MRGTTPFPEESGHNRTLPGHDEIAETPEKQGSEDESGQKPDITGQESGKIRWLWLQVVGGCIEMFFGVMGCLLMCLIFFSFLSLVYIAGYHHGQMEGGTQNVSQPIEKETYDDGSQREVEGRRRVGLDLLEEGDGWSRGSVEAGQKPNK